MVNTIFLGSALVVAVSAMPGMEAEFNFASLLKRQQPGTPAYNCHDNCGQVIIQNRQLADAVCSNTAFQSNYKNCLQCAGPDNYGIWAMYGNSVSAAGTKCGLSTTPLAGKQPDVGPAQTAAVSSTTTPPAPSSTTTSAQQPTITTSGGPAPTSTTAATTTTGGGSGASSSTIRASSSSSGVATSSGVSSTTRATSVSSASSSGSGSTTARPSTTGGSGSSNGTAPNPRPTVTAAAAQNVAGVIGAVVALGAAVMAL